MQGHFSGGPRKRKPVSAAPTDPQQAARRPLSPPLIHPSSRKRPATASSQSVPTGTLQILGVWFRLRFRPPLIPPDENRKPSLTPRSPPLGRTCSASSNRLVRTRTLGGVGAGRGNPPGYPIYVAELAWACCYCSNVRRDQSPITSTSRPEVGDTIVARIDECYAAEIENGSLTFKNSN